MLLEGGISSQALEAGPRSLLSANLLGQMDSCISSKGGRQAWGIPEKLRFFMEGQMMPLAVSGRGKKNQKGSFLRD